MPFGTGTEAVPVADGRAFGVAGHLVHAVDAVTGMERWVGSLAEGLSGLDEDDSPGRLMTSDQFVVSIAPTEPRTVEAFDAASGDHRWFRWADYRNKWGLDEEQLYWDYDLSTYGATGLDEGETRWENAYERRADHGRTGVVTEETLYLSTIADWNDPNRLVAIDKYTGEERWSSDEVTVSRIPFVISGDDVVPDTIYHGGRAIRNEGLTDL